MGEKRVTRAIIPVAGQARRLFPASSAVLKGLMPLVQADGQARAVLDIMMRQARVGGIEQFALVVSPGQQEQFGRYFCRHEPALAGQWGEQARVEAEMIADLAGRIAYVEQPAPLGLGHAVWCARNFAAGQPLLVLLGDQVFLPAGRIESTSPGPIETLQRVFVRLGGASATAVQPRSLEELHRHGTLAGQKAVADDFADAEVFRIGRIIEKPDPDTARRELATPGLAERNLYLTHAGAYVFAPAIFDCLDELVRTDRRERGEIQLTTAQQMLLAGREPYYGVAITAWTGCDVGDGPALAMTQRLSGAEAAEPGPASEAFSQKHVRP